MRAGFLAAVALVGAAPLAAAAQDGQPLFDTHCALCHVDPQADDIPTLESIRALGTGAIVDSLNDGLMRIQGLALSTEERVAVAEFITGEDYVERAAAFATGLCERPPALPVLAPGRIWNGWGGDVRGRRHQADTGGLVAADVANLELKWAFGIPDVTQSRAQPAVVGDRLFMASINGAIYALDADTGCTFWTFQADAGVRTAISVGPVADGYAIYFADMQARAYAVDAQTGRRLWATKVDEHPAAQATGAPTLHDGVLYVVTSGVSEESAAAMPDYECCTFRGSLTALDAATGEVIWQTFTVDEPQPRGESETGKPLWGPAGSPIWSAPSIDVERGLIYAASGNAYADPPAETSDAVIAFSIETGEIVWVNQLTPGDAWIFGCDEGTSFGQDFENNPNCPEDVGPDFDFSATPALVTLADGRDLLVVTQKSGVGYALDPDDQGRTAWEYRWGLGDAFGGVWGVTTDGERAYFAVADKRAENPGGLHAVELATGQRAWAADPSPLLCDASTLGCSAAQSAALTSIPGVVFSGSGDGGLRAYDAATGEIIWSYDTNRAFDTVNGVAANGASMDGPGPVVAGGMVYVTAGNGGIAGMPGNVLLAFGVGE